MGLFEELKDKIKGANQTVVFPEATDRRIIGAASRLKGEGLLEPVLIGNVDEINNTAENFGVKIGGIEILDPENYEAFDEMVESFVERRKGKATEEDARKILLDENYFGTMLVHMDRADGLVSGAAHSTSDTVRPALQIIKTKPDVKLVSGAFIMVREDERYVFADCAININPNAEQLGEIAAESADTAKLFGIDPKVGMLSFSTKGSAAGEEVDKVTEALKVAQDLRPNVPIDGELQFDAAFVESVGKTKAPESEVAGEANVFVFPDLQSGNIGYKIAQRLGGFEAVGPILQGLNKPVNDLSRGCTEEDAYKTAIVTARLALLDD